MIQEKKFSTPRIASGASETSNMKKAMIRMRIAAPIAHARKSKGTLPSLAITIASAMIRSTAITRITAANIVTAMDCKLKTFDN